MTLNWRMPLAFALATAAAAGLGLPTALKAQQAGNADAQVTYSKDIAPILQRSCENCHRAGGGAPMPLTTYEEVRPWARAIKQRTGIGPHAGVKPPWYMEKNIGIQKYKDDPSLSAAEVAKVAIPAPPSGPTERLPLGTICGARSGDKGGNANVGLWVRSPEAYAWLERYLTVEKFRELVPEAAKLQVERYPLPNLLAINFIAAGLLGDGVAASTRADPQAKSFGEYLRAKVVEIPRKLIPA